MGGMNRFGLFCPARVLPDASRKSAIRLSVLLSTLLVLCLVTALVRQMGADSVQVDLPVTRMGLEDLSSMKGYGPQSPDAGVADLADRPSFLVAALEAIRARQGEKLVLPDWVIAEWYGGKAMEAAKLRRTLDYVTRTLRPDGSWSTTKVLDLLMETAAVETALGSIVRQQNGPALSVWQILGFNFKEIPEYFDKRDPELLERAMSFYNADQSEEWNRIHNIPWTAAMSLLFYEKVSRGNFITRLDTLDSRGRLWKQLYNTRLGKGTVERYKARALEYVHQDVRTS